MPLTIALFAHCSGAVGTAIAASATCAALAAAGVDVIICDLERPETWAPAVTARHILVHANPDRLARTVQDPRRLRQVIGRRPATGYWVWEAPGMPQSWQPWLRAFDDLWVPSSFVARALSKDADLPISVVPHPVVPPEPTSSRETLGLSADRFAFLYVFNARSNLVRKNPAGLIHAYRRAFPEEAEDAMLVLKTIGLREAEQVALQRLIAGRADILLLNNRVEPEELASLIAACDCYVSLHRAEGFGLTVAEAMYFARPVICTGYSGVMDFVSPETAYLVDSSIARLAARRGIFPAGTIFAEPDLDQAASLIRQVFFHRDDAAARGRKAAAAVKSELSPEVVGRRMKSLIEARPAGAAARRASNQIARTAVTK